MSLTTQRGSYSAQAAVPSDTVDALTISKQLPDAFMCCTTAGDVAIVTDLGLTITLKSVPLCVVVPLRHSRIQSTNTTATGIVELYQRTW